MRRPSTEKVGRMIKFLAIEHTIKPEEIVSFLPRLPFLNVNAALGSLFTYILLSLSYPNFPVC